MRVLLCSPVALSFPSVGGNVTTVRRLATHLRALGAAVQVLATPSLSDEIEQQAYRFRPDVVHAFHAFKAGVTARAIARRLSVPFVVTLTGTDVHSDLVHSERREVVRQVLEDADAVVAFVPEVAQKLQAILPSLTAKVHIIPQGFWLPPQEAWEVREHVGIEPDVPLLMLPANIRKVKRPILAIIGVHRLRRWGWDAHLLLVGDVLEADVWRLVKAEMQEFGWLHYLGAVPLERMASVYQAADIVLNTSKHEGGMANALLEAMGLRRPVLASRVPGNVSLVRDEENGLLFGSPDELAVQAERLLTDEALRQRLVQNAKAWVDEHCDPAEEGRRYWQVYEA